MWVEKNKVYLPEELEQLNKLMNEEIEMNMQWLKKLNLSDQSDLKKLAIHLIWVSSAADNPQIKKMIRKKFKQVKLTNTIWYNISIT